MLLRGNGAYSPEKLVIEQTANICSKTPCEQDSPDPEFSGAKRAAEREFEPWPLSVFFEWVKRKRVKDECSLSNWNRYSVFPLGNFPISRKLIENLPSQRLLFFLPLLI